jgi:hypothetical protein
MNAYPSTDLPFQACWIIGWCASKSTLLSSKDVQHVCIVVPGCSLRELVDGVCEERELVEKLFYRRRDGK